MKITQEDIESFKKAWLNQEEIDSIIESEKEFERTWVSYSFDYVKEELKKKLLSEEKAYV